jgi:hypothetical protein
MRVLLMAVLAMVGLAVSANSSEAAGNLRWSDHYANAKVQAASEQRPLLVVLENPEDPAGRFNSDQFAGDDAQRELLGHFQLCRMDVTTDYGKRVAAAFGAKKFPFTAITDKSARYITFQAAGPMTSEQWQQTLSSRMEGPVTATQPTTRRVEASKVITSWPSDAIYSVPSSCPNCIRNQYYR